MTKLDFGITIGSTNYDKYWVNAEITEKFSSPATFDCLINGSGIADFSIIAVGADFSLYEYDSAGSATRRFLGVINTVKRIGFNQIQVSGYDYGGKLLNSNVVFSSFSSVQTFQSGDTDTLDTIVGKLCSVNLDNASPWVVTKGTIDGSSTVIGKFEVPMISRWEALLMLARKVGKEIYINPATGTLNMVTLRGNTSSVKTYNLTGASTNAYASSHEFTNNNIFNDVTGIGVGKDNESRFQDISTTFCKTTFSDTYLTVSTTDPSVTTIYVKDTTNFPSSGNVVLVGVSTTLFPLGGYSCVFNYTSKTATSLTGSIPIGSAGGGILREAAIGTPVLLASHLIVDNNSAFPSSGTLLVGDEIINYSSKSSSTVFVVNQTVYNHRYRYDYTMTVGWKTSDATTIDIDSGIGTFANFPSQGVLKIITAVSGTAGYLVEYVTYTGKGASSFTGCSRGVMGSSPLALLPSSGVYLYPSEQVHPAGVLVYKYVTTPDANSSIGLKGRKSKTLRLERSSTVEAVDSQTSRYLELHKWGDQNAEFTTNNIFDYGAVALGDKLTVNDSTLNWSGYEVRVLGKTLTIDRTSLYELVFNVATYSDNPAEGNLPTDATDFYAANAGAKEGSVSASGSDDSIDNGVQLSKSGGIDAQFRPKAGGGVFTTQNYTGYIHSNNVWIDGTGGTAHTTPFYSYGVAVDTTGLFFFMQKASPALPDPPDPTGVEGALYYNTTTKTVRWYNGTVWASLGSGGGGTGVGWTEVGSDLQLNSGYVNLLLYPASGSTNIMAASIFPNASTLTYLGGMATSKWSGLYTKSIWCYDATDAYGVWIGQSGTGGMIAADGSNTNIPLYFFCKGTSEAVFGTSSGGGALISTVRPEVTNVTALGSSTYKWSGVSTKSLWVYSSANAYGVWIGQLDSGLGGMIAADGSNTNIPLYLYCKGSSEAIFGTASGGGVSIIAVRPEEDNKTDLGTSTTRFQEGWIMYPSCVQLRMSYSGTTYAITNLRSSTDLAFMKDLTPYGAIGSADAHDLGSVTYQWSTVWAGAVKASSQVVIGGVSTVHPFYCAATYIDSSGNMNLNGSLSVTGGTGTAGYYLTSAGTGRPTWSQNLWGYLSPNMFPTISGTNITPAGTATLGNASNIWNGIYVNTIYLGTSAGTAGQVLTSAAGGTNIWTSKIWTDATSNQVNPIGAKRIMHEATSSIYHTIGNSGIGERWNAGYFDTVDTTDIVMGSTTKVTNLNADMCDGLHLPATNGTAGQVLTSSGMNQVNWGAAAVGLSSLNGLTASIQTFTNDTNIIITSIGSAHILGFSGTLAKARGGTATSTGCGLWTDVTSNQVNPLGAKRIMHEATSSIYHTIGNSGAGERWNTGYFDTLDTTNITMGSTTKVTNLNADMCDGLHLPASNGSAGQVLTSSGTNQVNWGSGAAGITSLNGLTGSSQTFTNDTNITITSSGTAHTLGFSGTLSKARGGTASTTGCGIWSDDGTLLRPTGGFRRVMPYAGSSVNNTIGSSSEYWTTGYFVNLSITGTATFSAGLSVTSGTAAFGTITTSSSGLVTNLNADKVDGLDMPTVSGQSGKYLTNNGSTMSWGTPAGGGTTVYYGQTDVSSQAYVVGTIRTGLCNVSGSGLSSTSKWVAGVQLVSDVGLVFAITITSVGSSFCNWRVCCVAGSATTALKINIMVIA